MKKNKLLSALFLIAILFSATSIAYSADPGPTPPKVQAACVTDAGLDQSFCDDVPTITIIGSTNGEGASWSTSGTGSFVENALETVEYMPSPGDYIAGSVTLTLVNPKDGGCVAGVTTDDVIITFDHAPVNLTITALSSTLCETDASTTGFQLTSTYNNATGVQWSAGGGTFSPDEFSSAVTYFPTPLELAEGYINMSFTTSGSGVCNAGNTSTSLYTEGAPHADAGSDQQVCEDVAGSIYVSIADATNAGEPYWTTSGDGSFDDANAYSPTYFPGAGDLSAQTVTLTLVAPGYSPCPQFTDDVVISINPVPTVTIDQPSPIDVCASTFAVSGVSVSATTNGAGIMWSAGDGTFMPDNTSTSVTYMPSATELTGGEAISLTVETTNNGGCSPASTYVFVNVVTEASIDPLVPINSCGTNPIYITAKTGDYESLTWSGGSGTIGDPSSESGYYYPVQADVDAGSITLNVAVTPQSPCTLAASDNLTINFIPTPAVSATDNNIDVCVSDLSVTVSVGSSSGSDILWTGGAGSFSDVNALSTVYTFDPSEQIDGNGFYLQVTTINVGTCTTATDYVYINIQGAPSLIYAGADQNICGPGNVSLNSANLVGQGEPEWQTSGTGFFQDMSRTTGKAIKGNMIYVPSPADRAGHAVTLTFIYPGPCAVLSDDMIVTFGGPQVTAGTDIDICITDIGTPVQLAGIVNPSNDPDINWTIVSGSTAGSFSDEFDVNSTFTLDPNDTQVTLKLSAGLNGCGEVTDNVIINVVPLPVAIFPSLPICANDVFVLTATDVVTMTWTSTDGTGDFLPAPSSIDATYAPSPADILRGNVTFAAQMNGVAGCPVQNITAPAASIINPLATVTAGTDIDICITDIGTPVQLAGIVTPVNDPDINWAVVSGSTSGTFSNNLDVNSTFTLDPNDTQVTLKLSAGLNGCGLATDNVVINVIPFPTAVFPGLAICEGSSFNLTALNSATVNWGSVDGNGVFTPSSTSITAQYTPTAADALRGAVTFTAQLTSTVACPAQNITAATASVIHALPAVDAGTDLSLCAPAVIQLNAVPLQSGSDISAWTSNKPTSLVTINGSNGDATVTTALDSNVTAQLTYTYQKFYADLSVTGGYCTSADQVNITYLSHPLTKKDHLTAPAGIQQTLDIAVNDDFLGFTSYNVTLVDRGNYLANDVSVSPAGLLTYLNRDSTTVKQDTVLYKLEVCTISQIDTILVDLRNGPPFIVPTAVADTSVHKVENVPLVVEVDFSKLLHDYNNNITWGSFTLISSLSGASPFIGANGVVQFQYSSSRASVFTGKDELYFKVFDAFGDSVMARYYVDIVPDYNNPSVKPEDFVVINAVSPNGDGVNDFMYVYGLSEYHNTVVVYNRWSQKVWEAENYDNLLVKFEGIGNIKGLEGELPEGTYFYVIKNDGKDENGEKTGLFSGYIEVRR